MVKTVVSLLALGGLACAAVDLKPQTGQLCFRNEQLCIAAQILPTGNAFEMTLIAPQNMGYVSVGIGEWMINADIIVAWPTANQNYTISDRKAIDYVEPLVDRQQDAVLVPEKSGLQNGKHYITFRRPLRTGDSSDNPVVAGTRMAWIWALDSQRPSSAFENATLNPHGSEGVGRFSMALTPAGIAGTSVQARFDIGGLAFFHGLLMALVWLVAGPLAAFIARFLKATMGSAWFPGHWGTATVGVVLTLIGFGLGIAATRGAHFTTPHTIIGLIVVILTLLQAGWGIYIDRTFDPSRVKTPARDYLHHVGGYLLVLLSIANVCLGLLAFGPGSGWIFGLYGAWVGLIVFTFAGAQIRKTLRSMRTKEVEDIKSLS
ncbi:uncharacterized protein VTP21DRAFT_4131 [Calcarisporiella thermophila]|uniref:uncharacterized protein n=1 Tax=Calcarisporiella thermophila TaxID=911321 RepID=UPI0037437B37